ncbi:unnamed protein product [Protopolystoma xenopodis]|uniref:Far11/STRP N-terminal domain-containing protein n=1 Tax=Protopolystoma xenopodis TaxID=117903 RepID=A0A448WFU8_9PLAT|nr:unnamed protein product [Protopolystoma xenopodis]
MDDSNDDILKKEDFVGGFNTHDTQTNEDQSADIDFVYNDTDEYGIEIAELYCYTEEPEFFLNKNCFQQEFSKYAPTKWIESEESTRQAHVIRLLDQLESSSYSVRRNASRGLLYLLQGVFCECELEEDQITWARHNVYLCIECGILQSAISLLLVAINYDDWTSNNGSNVNDVSSASAAGGAAAQEGDGDLSCVSTTTADYSPAKKTPTTNIKDTIDLRIIISILYILVETVRDGVANQQSLAPSTTSDPHHYHQQNLVSYEPTTSGPGSNGLSGPQIFTLANKEARLRDQFIEELGK